MSTTEYSNVFEEHNQVSTKKLPSETELCKVYCHEFIHLSILNPGQIIILNNANFHKNENSDRKC
ncbi:MAG: hypothetical protein PG981_000584 [Wolbachia endosymbiont of Ctenocephalides orientis wCori]|nr:MAG: hypothetical protein PG981_000584 [Wolbachia endosymbiont of Ctenocephalides orientis wCori]